MHDEFFALLHKDHQTVQGLMEQIKKAPAAERERLFSQLKRELVPHMKGEEAGFYPALERHKEAQEHAWEAMEEHHVAETSLRELEQSSKQEERWKARFSVLAEIVNHHIREEESKVFEDAGKVLGHDQVRDVFNQFSDEKQRVQQRL